MKVKILCLSLLFCIYMGVTKSYAQQGTDDSHAALDIYLADPFMQQNDDATNDLTLLIDTQRDTFKHSKLSYRLEQLDTTEDYPNFDHNPLINAEMRRTLRSYLLPPQYSIKRVLDRIFTDSAVIDSVANIKKAGFTVISKNTSSHVLVVSHPKLKGVLLKIHPNDEPRKRGGLPAWRGFAVRCKLADKIQDIIERKHMRYFVAPNKWIYPLPPVHFGAPTRDRNRQPVVLVVEDMQLAPHAASVKAWRQELTKRHLDELFYILSRGYGSPRLPDNIPYTKNGQFAFVDTELKSRIDLTQIKKFIGHDLKDHWQQLLDGRDWR